MEPVAFHRRHGLRGSEPLGAGRGLAALFQGVVGQLAAADDHGQGQGSGQELGPQTVEEGLPRGHGCHRRCFPCCRRGSAARRRSLGEDCAERCLFRSRGRLQPAQQAKQEGHGSQAPELDALLFHGPDPRLHLFATLEELGLDGAGGDLQGLGDVLDGHILIVPHAHNELLLLREPGQDLLHQPGAFLPIQSQLRLGHRVQVRQLGLGLVLLACQLREAQGLPPGQGRDGDVHGDAPQPGQEGLVGLQLDQPAPGPEIAVLEHVPGQIFIPDHGAHGSVELRAGLLVKLGKGGLVPGLGLGHQLRGDFDAAGFARFCFQHKSHPSLSSLDCSISQLFGRIHRYYFRRRPFRQAAQDGAQRSRGPRRLRRKIAVDQVFVPDRKTVLFVHGHLAPLSSVCL